VWGEPVVLIGERKELGAYYTPIDLAQYLAGWAVVSPKSVILEPSVGQGALVAALVDRLDRSTGGMVVGYEIDKNTFVAAKIRFAGKPVVLFNSDFLDSYPTTVKPVDAVVANPPFTRNHSLNYDYRQKLRQRPEFVDNVIGAPGLWVYFILWSLSFLKFGGRLAFVVPGSVAFTGYSAPTLRSRTAITTAIGWLRARPIL
jgi:adenine-specific DNA-methyltransferase